MKEIRIESFVDINDALLFLEKEIYDIHPHSDVKGEIEYINGEWRVGIITNDTQLDLWFFDEE